MPHVPFIVRALALTGCVAGLVACGRPPELHPPPGTPVPQPSVTTTTTPTPLLPPTQLPSQAPTAPPVVAPTFGEEYAVSCAGYPSGDAVVALLRRTPGLLSANARVAVRTGPLCAGTWQYTVVAVGGRDPLAAVTRGKPDALRLVTAGTDVCSIPVRTAAPPGIQFAAACP
ncbi:MAG TPA: hypothetical protein VGJ63_08025 [Micromonosporaceae bacterium]